MLCALLDLCIAVLEACRALHLHMQSATCSAPLHSDATVVSGRELEEDRVPMLQCWQEILAIHTTPPPAASPARSWLSPLLELVAASDEEMVRGDPTSTPVLALH